MIVANAFTVVFCSVGMFFFLAGTIGLIRFPDVLSRLHALTKADNLGLGLILLGLIPQANSAGELIRMALVWGLIIFSSAACSYLISSQVISEAGLTARNADQEDPK